MNTENRWYRNAIIYGLDVETFYDGDGDGVGDFKGLIEKLDHFVELGVTTLWLLPFFPTPNRDNGYDISNYLGVDPRLGTRRFLGLHNLSDGSHEVTFEIPSRGEFAYRRIASSDTDAPEELEMPVALGRYGSAWYRADPATR